MSDWLDRPKVAALCGFCWTDDVNAECPEHGRDAMRDAALAHFKALSENLKADNARLRALVDEKANKFDYCVWCGREMPYGYRDEKRIEHTHDCPACTPEGLVK